MNDTLEKSKVFVVHRMKEKTRKKITSTRTVDNLRGHDNEKQKTNIHYVLRPSGTYQTRVFPTLYWYSKTLHTL